MTLETKNRDHQIKLRQFCKTAGEKAELWIDDATGQIVELPVESRIRSGLAGCQVCHEDLDGTERHGRVEFDERNLPRLVFGPGEGVQPVPPRYKLVASRTLGLEERRKSVDLVGIARDQHAITSDVRKIPPPTLPEPRRPLLLRKRGGP